MNHSVFENHGIIDGFKIISVDLNLTKHECGSEATFIAVKDLEENIYTNLETMHKDSDCCFSYCLLNRNLQSYDNTQTYKLVFNHRKDKQVLFYTIFDCGTPCKTKMEIVGVGSLQKHHEEINFQFPDEEIYKKLNFSKKPLLNNQEIMNCDWEEGTSFERLVKNIEDADWRQIFEEEYTKPYFKHIEQELEKSHAIFYKDLPTYPPKDKVFAAFNKTPFKSVKVVILAMDPYHSPGAAMGLAFSVPKGAKIQPSLKNMYKELEQDEYLPDFKTPNHGDLTKWAEQGVLLINRSLTVRQGNAGSHSKFGWYNLTERIIREISERLENVVFMLWGNHAKTAKQFINTSKHKILESVHPSPLSASRGYFGCKHFSKANSYLKEHGKAEIVWSDL
jgi:uracil-DNA glycosylase